MDKMMCNAEPKGEDKPMKCPSGQKFSCAFKMPTPECVGISGSECNNNEKICDKGLICLDGKCASPPPSPTPKPSPPTPKPSPGPSSDSQGMSTPAVVGISVGGVVLLIGIIFGIIYLAKKKKKGRK